MTISYNWLQEYLPVNLDPERLSRILTSIGLEVESFEKYESIKGGLAGLVVGEVKEKEKHPNADKLSVTKVDIGTGELLQIVCGAPNVAAGQKVIVAPVGTTIYPNSGDPLTMKLAKIRSVESQGMICAQDEVGLGEDHSGILVLAPETRVGSPVAELYETYSDYIYEIGLTPNRMDAMSHLGVARDVCAYLTHHDRLDVRVKQPSANSFKPGKGKPVKVTIENKNACQRYAGISIKNITVKESPKWLQEKLRAIGQRPINNIVDITNFILHETGQPLHAFDLKKIGEEVIIGNLPEGTPFITLDTKDRKLNAADLMICDGSHKPLCIAGVFGGLDSGVKDNTTQIFLESAWFNPIDIRKTSFRHGLRTDAATHFEKNIDISNTVNVLKRAALLIVEIAGGEIESELVDVYPDPKEKTAVTLKYHFLKKLSGKNYHPDTVRKIVTGLGFEVAKDSIDDVRLLVPFSKPDISLPADVVEEIMRIDGLDNVEIPGSITISPSIEQDGFKQVYTEKVASYLAGLGFNEILTNSITNKAYYDEKELENAVTLLNNLSADHNMMRPSMLETGLEAVAYNLNRKNAELRFFEFGKTYTRSGEGKYSESKRLCIYITGNLGTDTWKGKASSSDLYYIKGVVARILQLIGVSKFEWEAGNNAKLESPLQVKVKGQPAIETGIVAQHELKRFDIKQPVFFADISWDQLLAAISKQAVQFRELPKQLPVHRDLAMVVDKAVAYESIEKTIRKQKLQKLQKLQLFDVFESDKLGTNKKSLAVSFTFLDEQKTLTDVEVDEMMQQLIKSLINDLQVEIRK
ncbi:MAG: phenylalanine--tRNA ligase subunit beta [Chitinophagaceae bacterium]|nr:MAG: phenylalanine--tRNA ligase subunit beta [Chitinophagaceae bacterium]